MKIAVTKVYKNRMGTYSTGYNTLKFFRTEKEAKGYCEKKNKVSEKKGLSYKVLYLN